MSGGFTIHFPAKIGDVVYAVTKNGYIQKEVVTGYMVRGDGGDQIEVRLTHLDRFRETYTRRVSAGEFGKTIFPMESQAILALRERLGV